MTEQPTVSAGSTYLVEREGIQELLDALHHRGYQVLGPTLRQQPAETAAIVYDTIESLADLPSGWTDCQDAGTYRLEERQDDALFAYRVGPHSWKQFLHPPWLRLWQAARTEDGFQVVEEEADMPRYAFIGVRACELKAMTIQDQVLLRGDYGDPVYRRRRESLFIVAVNCTEPGNTCFCASMDAGPVADNGYDLAITEIVDGERHHFLLDVGSDQGRDVLAEVDAHVATESQIRHAREVLDQAAVHMGREMETADLPSLLYANLEHPRWEEVANRCLTCGNCTMVCPTCFCTSVEETTDLTGQQAARIRRWDSCFTLNFSYMHGGSLRESAKSRYRQWMTHKLASWIDQFQVIGCVGCGRCITWCPVGIDITVELQAIRNSRAQREEQAGTTAPAPVAS